MSIFTVPDVAAALHEKSAARIHAMYKLDALLAAAPHRLEQLQALQQYVLDLKAAFESAGEGQALLSGDLHAALSNLGHTSHALTDALADGFNGKANTHGLAVIVDLLQKGGPDESTV